MANPKTPKLGLNKVDRSSPTTTTFNTKPIIDDNADILDAEVTKLATTAVDGRMSAADKAKLNGIATNANNYSHPTSHPATMITEDTTHRFASDAEKAAWNAKAPTDSPEFTGALTEGGYHTSKLIGAVSPSSGVANQKIDLFFGNGNNHASTFHGLLEITVAGVMNGGVASGAVTRTYGLVLQPNGVLSDQDTRYSEVTGKIDEHVAISPVTWDAINARWKIQIIFRSNVVNTYSIYLVAQSGALSHIDNISTLAIGNFYTTDTTAWPAPVVTFNKYVMGVTKPTDDVSNVLATTALVQAKVDAQLAEAPSVPVTLSPGLQRIDSDRQARLAHVGFSGRTLVNILGRDGGCESLAPFSNINSATTSLASNRFRSGSSSIKFAMSESNTYLSKDYTYKLNQGNCYLLGAWAFVESYTSGASVLTLRDVGTLNSKYIATLNMSLIGQWQFTYIRVPLSNTLLGDGFRLFFGPSTPGTSIIYWDEIRLYEITTADFLAINSMTPEQVAARWPYTEGISNVDNMFVKRYGRNLLKGVPETNFYSGKVNGPYDYTLTATASFQANTIYADVLPSTTYTFSVKQQQANSYYYGIEQDTNGNVTVAVAFTTLTSGGVAASDVVKTFTTSATTTRIRVQILNSNTTTGTYSFKNWQLELGSTATPFTPNDDQSLYAYNTQASGSVDGSVADQVYTDVDGRLRISRQFQTIPIMGNRPWSVFSVASGIKRVNSAISNNIGGLSSNYQKCLKYDGTSLQFYGSAPTAPDQFVVSRSDGILYVSIANSDSGWGGNFSPIQPEVQAYFYGWKMNNGTLGQLYDGSGTKTWTRWDATSNAGALTTVPTTQAAGYTPYQLQYQLAAPVDEPISQEGAITLMAGINQAEMGSGMIVRERVTPAVYQSKYYIGATSSSSLQFRSSKILEIYRNGVPDLLWNKQIRIPGDAAILPHGTGFADIVTADYDASAVYTVTYMVLDTYLTGIAPLAITGDRAANTRGNVDEVIDTQADMLGRLDVLDSGVQAAFTHGVERKAEVVAVLNAKGITATTAESWDSLISKMTAIVKATGNATPADVLAGKEFSTAAGNAKLGTMPNNGTKVYTPTSGNVPIDAGYHVGSVVAAVAVPADKVLTGTSIAGTPGTMPNKLGIIPAEGAAKWNDGALAVYPSKGYYKGGSGDGEIKVTIDQLRAAEPNLVSGSIKAGASLFGVSGDAWTVWTGDVESNDEAVLNGYRYWAYGNKRTGVMPNRSAESNHQYRLEQAYWAPGTASNPYPRLFLRPPHGYYNGSTWVYHDEPNLVPSNIRRGASMFGIDGTGPIVTTGNVMQTELSVRPLFRDHSHSDRYFYMVEFPGPGWVPDIVILTYGHISGLVNNSRSATIYRNVGGNLFGVGAFGFGLPIVLTWGDATGTAGAFLNSTGSEVVNANTIKLPVYYSGVSYRYELIKFT